MNISLEIDSGTLSINAKQDIQIHQLEQFLIVGSSFLIRLYLCSVL